MIESTFAKIKKWTNKNSIIFDFNKFKAIHFLYKKAFSNLDIRLPPFILLKHNISEQIIRLVRKKTLIR